MTNSTARRQNINRQPEHNQAVKNEINSFDVIKESHALSGNPSKIKQYYDQWSKHYDQDVSEEAYSGPNYIANYFDLLPKQSGYELDVHDRSIEILDSGCGTGLVGLSLRQRGYQNIDGFDLSHNMIEKAGETQAYRQLKGGCDMTNRIEAFEDDRYDAAISCGVFTTGHVPPSALLEMIRLTKPGGLVVVSTRKSYYESTDFQALCDRLQADKTVDLIGMVMDAPYIAEEGAHYWAFRVR